MNGVAVINACNILVERLQPYKVSNPEGKWEDWISKAYLDRVNLNAFGFYDLSKVDFNFMENSGTSFDYLVFGAGCVEVEVDCQTGDIAVLSVDIVMDVGRSLNPAIDIGQVNQFISDDVGVSQSRQNIFLKKHNSSFKIWLASFYILGSFIKNVPLI